MFFRSLFASRCAACDRDLPRAAPLCEPCSESLWPIDVACPGCALPLEGPVSVSCRRCRVRPSVLAGAVSPLRYGGELAVAIRRLKYGGRPDLCRSIASLFAPALAAEADRCDVLIPVPLHWRREMRRGFNQSRVLLRFGLPRSERKKIDAVSLRRISNTPPQSGLRAAEREDNVRGVFEVLGRRRRRVAGARVLLFDDVITTGATIRAGARALVRAGAREVIGFAVARAS